MVVPAATESKPKFLPLNMRAAYAVLNSYDFEDCRRKRVVDQKPPVQSRQPTRWQRFQARDSPLKPSEKLIP